MQKIAVNVNARQRIARFPTILQANRTEDEMKSSRVRFPDLRLYDKTPKAKLKPGIEAPPKHPNTVSRIHIEGKKLHNDACRTTAHPH